MLVFELLRAIRSINRSFIIIIVLLEEMNLMYAEHFAYSIQ